GPAGGLPVEAGPDLAAFVGAGDLVPALVEDLVVEVDPLHVVVGADGAVGVGGDHGVEVAHSLERGRGGRRRRARGGLHDRVDGQGTRRRAGPVAADGEVAHGPGTGRRR